MQCNHAFIVIWAPCYMCVVPCACTTHCCTGLEPLNKWKKEHEVCEGKGLIKAADGCRVLSAQCTCSYAHDDSSCSYNIDLTQLMMMNLYYRSHSADDDDFIKIVTTPDSHSFDSFYFRKLPSLPLISCFVCLYPVHTPPPPPPR